jgi:hypothetical protein
MFLPDFLDGVVAVTLTGFRSAIKADFRASLVIAPRDGSYRVRCRDVTLPAGRNTCFLPYM